VPFVGFEESGSVWQDRHVMKFIILIVHLLYWLWSKDSRGVKQRQVLPWLRALCRSILASGSFSVYPEVLNSSVPVNLGNGLKPKVL